MLRMAIAALVTVVVGGADSALSPRHTASPHSSASYMPPRTPQYSTTFAAPSRAPTATYRPTPSMSSIASRNLKSPCY